MAIFSSSEAYSVPALVKGSGLFVGGTFYEKKQLGLYNVEFEHKYFENTREKVPSLRVTLYMKALKMSIKVL